MLETLLRVAEPTVSLAITMIFLWLTQQVVQRMKTGAAKDAMLELIAAAEVVVRNTAQVVKPELAAKAKDGKLDDADFAELKSAAMSQLRDQLSEQAKVVLEKNGTHVEDAMSRAIEAMVHKMKQPPAAEPAPVESKEGDVDVATD